MLNLLRAIALVALIAGQSTPPGDSAPVEAGAAAGTGPPVPPRTETPVPDCLPSYFELAAEVRAELPDLELTLIRYDPKPADRFVVMNGRRITEGLPAGRDLWVHEIRPRAVVMRYIDRYFLLAPR